MKRLSFLTGLAAAFIPTSLAHAANPKTELNRCLAELATYKAQVIIAPVIQLTASIGAQVSTFVNAVPFGDIRVEATAWNPNEMYSEGDWAVEKIGSTSYKVSYTPATAGSLDLTIISLSGGKVYEFPITISVLG